MIIGDNCAVTKEGNKRLFDETDWVRIEVETVLETSFQHFLLIHS